MTFTTPRDFHQFLKITQGHGAPNSFVRLIQCAIAGLDFILMYLYDAKYIFGATLALHVESIEAFLRPLEEHSLIPKKSRVGAMKVDFPGHNFSSSGLGPDTKEVEDLAKVSKHADVFRLRSSIEFLLHFCEFLPNRRQRI